MQMAVPHIHTLVPYLCGMYSHSLTGARCDVVDMRKCKDMVTAYIQCEILLFVSACFSF